MQVSGIYGTSEFITMFTKLSHWFLYWHRRIHFRPSRLFLKIYLNIIFLFSPTSYKKYILLVFPQNLYGFLTNSMLAIWPAHPILLDLITSIGLLLEEEYDYEAPRYAVSLASCCIRPHRFKCCPQYNTLKLATTTSSSNQDIRHTSRREAQRAGTELCGPTDPAFLAFQPHTPAALPTVPVGWARQSVWTLWTRGKPLLGVEPRFSVRPIYSLVTVLSYFGRYMGQTSVRVNEEGIPRIYTHINRLPALTCTHIRLQCTDGDPVWRGNHSKLHSRMWHFSAQPYITHVIQHR
jgi:hypothetical protein